MECLTKVEAYLLPLNSDPQKLVDLLLKHNQQAQELMLIRGYRRVDAMIYHFFELISKKFGQEVEAGKLIDLRLTHQDIADMIGSTRVTVTRLMKQFQNQGIIERSSIHQIIFKEREDLLWHYEI